jgi:hypothetical protein
VVVVTLVLAGDAALVLAGDDVDVAPLEVGLVGAGAAGVVDPWCEPDGP